MIKDDVQFACVCAHVWMHHGLEGERGELGRGYYLEPPWHEFDLEDWANEIGRWQLDEIKNANLWVWATGPQGTIRRETITNLWSGLLLTRPPRVHSAWLLTGTLKNGQPSIGMLQRLGDVYIKEPPFPLNLQTLREAAEAGYHLGRAFDSGRLRGRLERGLSSLLLAMGVGYVDDSLLFLERALEGVVHPASKVQFAKRAAAILERSPDSDSVPLLEQLYDVRSAFAHAETLETVFPEMSQAAALQRIRELQTFTYFLASRSYRAILECLKLMEKFGSEGLGPYWGKVVARRVPPPFRVSVLDEEWNFEQDEDYYALDPEGRRRAGLAPT